MSGIVVVLIDGGGNAPSWSCFDRIAAGVDKINQKSMINSDGTLLVTSP